MYGSAIDDATVGSRNSRCPGALLVLVQLAFGAPGAAQLSSGAPEAPEASAANGVSDHATPEIRQKAAERPRATAARYVNANADRVLLAPTAETQPAGTLYFSVYELLPQVGYAITNRTQIALGGLGAPQGGFVDLSIKSNIMRKRNIRVSVGAAIDYAGVDGLNFGFGRASSVLQWCFRAHCLSSLSAGGTIILHNAPGVALPYGISLGLTTYLSDTTTLLLEYTSLMNATEDLFFIDFPIFLVSYGVRVRANPNWALDVAMVQSLSSSPPSIGRDRAIFEVLGFPFVAYTYRWGRAR